MTELTVILYRVPPGATVPLGMVAVRAWVEGTEVRAVLEVPEWTMEGLKGAVSCLGTKISGS